MSKQEAQQSFSGKFEERGYLLDAEVDKLIESARKVGRYGHRDALMILMTYRHGLRASELVNLRWDHVQLEQGNLVVERLKHGDASVQPMTGEEIRALRKLKRDQAEGSVFVFTTERGGPMEVTGFNKLVKRAGVLASLPVNVHPHMLRHSCGHQLAAKGVDTRAIQGYLGHRNIQHTVIYTKLAANRFKDFGKLI